MEEGWAPGQGGGLGGLVPGGPTKETEEGTGSPSLHVARHTAPRLSLPPSPPSQEIRCRLTSLQMVEAGSLVAAGRAQGGRSWRLGWVCSSWE